MTDLFDKPSPAPAAPAADAPARKPFSLHSDTDIYRAVTELCRHITLAVADMRRDAKPTLGRFLTDESVWMGVLVLRANKARGPEKLAHLEALLEQVEVVQMGLRLGRECRFVANRAFTDAIPLTTSVAKQATALRNHFVSAPQ